MVEMQVERFRRLGLNRADVDKLIPQWRRIVGLGIRIARDWAESSDDGDSHKGLTGEKKPEVALKNSNDPQTSNSKDPVVIDATIVEPQGSEPGTASKLESLNSASQ
ncbi:hypothetical protein H072_223 [Dactylellina haptotyla CBS 200.50]|uniref:Uncharacterized protein n=1 Tax=Dactylellina haptotyla (strain CBS 200.50) TaxID=1284197 RepID=S8AS82_DACHA|nr:hypothetical protein H072_223 [Dactylellina haptotyla CBS 200.50]